MSADAEGGKFVAVSAINFALDWAFKRSTILFRLVFGNSRRSQRYTQIRRALYGSL